MAGRWQQAVQGVLRSYGSESPKIEEARRLYWERNDPAAAAAAMPKHMHAEHACLEVCSEGTTMCHLTPKYGGCSVSLQLGARAAKLLGLSAEIDCRDGAVVESARVWMFELSLMPLGVLQHLLPFLVKKEML